MDPEGNNAITGWFCRDKIVFAFDPASSPQDLKKKKKGHAHVAVLDPSYVLFLDAPSKTINRTHWGHPGIHFLSVRQWHWLEDSLEWIYNSIFISLVFSFCVMSWNLILHKCEPRSWWAGYGILKCDYSSNLHWTKHTHTSVNYGKFYLGGCCWCFPFWI